MLQVRDLTKRYTTKGETVEALHGVSVDFPEKGMVFLLGKSGSGKSTLLNLAGGLDEPDEGEIIVKGKSSKEFTPADFDSYRNTYIGFIFQEYNILNELTVGENVALALELQGRPRDREHVEELLKMVDMQGYYDRKPNTLSGGQKQRIAIARALVKEPEIIMGDEPTGALDSQTGAQVFDTLKKLSREKLVVIVSHDRDFAEAYADRIIELKDGRIISDVTRSGEAKEASNLVEAGPKKLAVVSGAAMTQEDEARVLAFLRANKGGILLSAEKEDVSDVRAPEGVGTFSPTNASPAPREEDTAVFLPSRFPARYAFKMGLAGLRAKPLRLIVTTLLAAIAFLVFGVFSTMITYSPADMGVSGLLQSAIGAATLQKKLIMHGINDDGQEYTSLLPVRSGATNFTEEEAEAVRAESGTPFIPVYDFASSIMSLLSSYGKPGSDVYTDSAFYKTFDSISGFANVSYAKEAGFALVAGTYPEAEDEGMISLSVAEAFVGFGYRASSDASSERIQSVEDIVGKTIRLSLLTLGEIYVTVTGVFDAEDDFSRYDSLRVPELPGNAEATALAEEFSEAYEYSFSSVCFTGEGFYERYDHFDRSRREYQNLMQQVENYGGTTSYTEDSASFIRYSRLMAPLAGNAEERAQALFAYYGKEEKERDISYYIPYEYLTEIDSGQKLYEIVFPVIGAAAGVLAVFAALLLFSFISASINAKKKDIGILRAVGARGIDVFKIFIVEGIAITLLCLVLGVAGSIAACAITNGILIAEAGLGYEFFLFGWENALILFGIAAVTSLIATVIPVAVFSKKRPVETIRSV